MLKKMRELMENRESGFTLIELLVVVIIIGILAAIAIPVFLNQRNGARDASVKSDINAISKNIETAYTNNNVYPDQAAFDAEQPRVSPGNQIVAGYYDNTGAATSDPAAAVSYVICGYNTESSRSFLYDSANGGLQETNAPGTKCDDVTAWTAGTNVTQASELGALTAAGN